MKKDFIDKIFFSMIVTLIFSFVIKPLQLNFLGGMFGTKLTLYPTLFGLLYTCYCQYRYGNVFISFTKFRNYIVLYFIVYISCTIFGLVRYPFYDDIINCPTNQIDKLPILYALLESHGICISKELLVQAWIIVRVLKGVVSNTIYTFGVSYMIYCWYFNRWQEGFKIVLKGVLITVLIVCAYSSIEMFAFVGNDAAKTLLVKINPLLFPIKEFHGWWPPLLWDKQFRSVFAEPSFLGIWSAFSLPFMWHYMFNSVKYKFVFCVINIFFHFVLFMANARTATALLLGEVALFVIFAMIKLNREYLKKAMYLISVVSIAFVISLRFVEYVNITNTSIQSNQAVSLASAMNGYVKENVESIVKSNSRSNGARFATIYANLQIFKKNPLTGVGIGLTSGYMPDNFPDYVKDNQEVQNWIKYQKMEGILKRGIGSFSEYSRLLAEVGIFGFLLFFYPVLFLLWYYFKNNNSISIEKILVAISMAGMLASGLSNSVNTTYCYWIVLGLGYAMTYNKTKE